MTESFRCGETAGPSEGSPGAGLGTWPDLLAGESDLDSIGGSLFILLFLLFIFFSIFLLLGGR